MLIYTDLAHEIVSDIARTVKEFSHLQPEGIAIAAAPRWAGSSCGHLGKCYGLGERESPSFTVWVRGRRGRRVIEVSRWYQYEPVEIDFHGQRCMYLIELHLPRMLDHDPLETLVHELFHIGEGFDGKLRPMRHGRMFDWRVRNLMQAWLRQGDPRLVELSRASLSELIGRFGAVLGRRLPPRFKPMRIVPAEAPMPYEEALPRHFPGYRLEPGYRVQPAPLSPPGIPGRVKQGECPLRHYHPDGSEALPAGLARYLGRASRVEAMP
jgi:predicted metallopeptidase